MKLHRGDLKILAEYEVTNERLWEANDSCSVVQVVTLGSDEQFKGP